MQNADVVVIDDDPGIRDALSVTFTLEGYAVSTYQDAESFLARPRWPAPGCILLDIHLPGKSGLDVLRELNEIGLQCPVVIVSGHGDIPKAVEAMRHGASDFVEKPFDSNAVISVVRRAMSHWRTPAPAAEPHVEIDADLRLLTSRELEVLRQTAAGLSSKETARLLSISPRTVEVHRRNIMSKLNAKNTADLVRIAYGTRRKVA